MEFPEKPQYQNRRTRRRLGLGLAVVGMLVFLLGAKPEWFGMNISAVVGYVQVSVFSLGLFLMCLGGVILLNALWPKGERSILADIGMRLAFTGFVVAMASGMADVFGLGTRPLPETTTFFGYWQARGVLLGELIMIISFLMMFPWKVMNRGK
jgi:hypothetical protein